MPSTVFVFDDNSMLYLLLPTRNAIKMFTTGEGILTQEDKVTPIGLQEVFATNLFGHFLLVSGRFWHNDFGVFR